VARKGKARPARGGVGLGLADLRAGVGGGSGAGAAGGGAGGGGGGGGAPRRTRLPQSDTKANIYDRPNTVVMECQEFATLPPDEEVVKFIFEQVLSAQENKDLFPLVESLFSDENARKILVRMKCDQSTERLAELLAPGVAWPGYKNEEKDRDVMVFGYSMEKPVMNITLSGIGWWTTEAVVRSVVETWGEVKEMSRGKTEFHGHTITTDKWMVKLVKKKEITIPPIVFHAGSDRSSEEREMWKVFYRGVIKVCYRCLKEGHFGRDCEDNPVTIEYLASQVEYEGAPAAPSDAEVISGERRTFAQIVKDNSFIETRLARQKLADQLRQEKADKAREDREKRDEKRKERRELDRRRKGGFRINKSGDESQSSEDETGDEKKRLRFSPGDPGPDSKTSRLSSSGGGQSSDHNRQRDSRGGPPGN
jgi:hypothetical protein